MLFDSKKLFREALRVKLLADRCPCKYAFHIEAGSFRVAPAVDYRLARLAGMKDFWKLAPPLVDRIESLVPPQNDSDAGYGEWGFSCVRDGDGETYAPGRVEIVGKADSCMWLSPKQFRDIVNNAKDQAPACDDKRDDVDGGNVAAAFHEAYYTR